VALRNSAESAPDDILGPGGSLAGQDIPCLTAARDACTAGGLPHWRKFLFATFDVLTLAILRSLGLPATFATGLAQLDGRGLRDLIGEPHVLTHNETNSAASRCAPSAELWRSVEKLVLVGWSVATLSRRKPHGLHAVAELFGGAQAGFAFDTSRIMVWRPTQSQLQQIQCAARLRDVELARHAIAQSVDVSVGSIDRYVSQHQGLPAGQAFFVARTNLTQLLEQEQQQNLLSYRFPGIQESYRQAFERAFVQPLVREASSASDPIDGAVALATADLVQEWHNRSPLMTCCNENARAHLPWVVPTEFEALRQRLKIADYLIGIWRERRKHNG
jgi:hypothetical protein